MEKIKSFDFSRALPVLGAFILFITLGFLCSWQGFQTSAETKSPDILPPGNWVVREDLGLGEVPGGPEAHRFAIGHDSGWVVIAYCLDPEETLPPLGTTCELVDTDTFWCGDLYQRLRYFQTLKMSPLIVANVDLITSTSTIIATSSPTNAHTPTPEYTSTVTPLTPELILTPRPQMGGSGNLSTGDVLRGMLGIILFGMGGTLAFIEVKKVLASK